MDVNFTLLRLGAIASGVGTVAKYAVSGASVGAVSALARGLLSAKSMIHANTLLNLQRFGMTGAVGAVLCLALSKLEPEGNGLAKIGRVFIHTFKGTVIGISTGLPISLTLAAVGGFSYGVYRELNPTRPAPIVPAAVVAPANLEPVLFMPDEPPELEDFDDPDETVARRRCAIM